MISTVVMAVDQITSIGRCCSHVASKNMSARAGNSSSGAQRIKVTGTLGKMGVREASILGIWPLRALNQSFPGLGKEFMPPLDEGSFLYMPTMMPHASIGEALDILQKQDIRISQIPEVENVVGKLGRVDSPLPGSG